MKRLALAVLCVLVCLSCTSCKKDEKVLNVYIWTEYLPQEVKDDFKAKTGITIREANYGSNEELLEKLQSGVADYDIVVPSDYMVHRLITRGLVAPLDRSKLAGFENLDPKFVNPTFDPGNKYSVPYFWGTTGIGFNTDKTGGPVNSWDALFDEKYKGQISMLNDGRECFAVALEKMGKSVNETDPAVLKQVAELLKKQKPLVRAYDSDSFHEKLSSGDVAVAHGYNGQFAKVIKDNPKLGFAVPKEGGTFWMDNLCVPAKARHAEAAHAFIAYVLQPEVSAKIAKSVGYGSPNAAGRKLLSPEVVNNAVIYPPEDVLNRCKFMEDLGESAKLINQYFTEVKAQ